MRAEESSAAKLSTLELKLLIVISCDWTRACSRPHSCRIARAEEALFRERKRQLAYSTFQTQTLPRAAAWCHSFYARVHALHCSTMNSSIHHSPCAPPDHSIN